MPKVTAPFRDRETWRAYDVGDEYVGGRADELAAEGLVEAPAPPPADIPPCYASMTCPQLRALCDEWGIDVPRRATKPQLVAALEGNAP